MEILRSIVVLLIGVLVFALGLIFKERADGQPGGYFKTTWDPLQGFETLKGYLSDFAWWLLIVGFILIVGAVAVLV